jgi:hypothetical protein
LVDIEVLFFFSRKDVFISFETRKFLDVISGAHNLLFLAEK